MTLAAFKTKSSEAHSALKGDLYSSYRFNFPGDNLWFGQLDSATDAACDIAKKIALGKETKLLLLAAEVRKKLDDDLAHKSGLLQRFGLDGTHFTKSHPAPSSRPEIAKINFKVLLVRMNSIDLLNM